MTIQKIFEEKSATCPVCMAKGHKILGNYADYVNIGGESFEEYCESAEKNGRNIIHGEYGCQKCNPIANI